MDHRIPHILLIDSYDSFTYNLAALCRKAIPTCKVHIIKNDAYSLEDLLPYLYQFSAIVIGPGPGSPRIPSDIGVVGDLWKVSQENMVPIFGVCLGLQSLSVEHGASLYRLHAVKHGQVSDIHHNGVDIFSNMRDTKAVRYHSLHVKLQEGGEVEELAWTEDEENGRIVMGVRHKTKPFWAVQYHPESVCTDDGGLKVLQNFWTLAQEWNQGNCRTIAEPGPQLKNSQTWPYFHQRYRAHAYQKSISSVRYTSFHAPNLSIISICEYFGAHDDSKRFVLLDSAAHPGRFSILACLSETSPQFIHYVHENYLESASGATKQRHGLGGKDIWTWLAEYRESRRVRDGSPVVPFWGGFAGYLSYEAGLGSLQATVHRNKSYKDSKHPDVNLVWVDRSIVIDMSNSQVYVQSLLPDDGHWIQETVKCLSLLPRGVPPTVLSTTKIATQIPTVMSPDRAKYISSIKQAQQHLFAGDSYELCFTAPTRIVLSKGNSISSWERYKALKQANAAPHSAYIRLHPTTFLSSSPERFLSYSRSPGTVCQLRPIKGTVRKAPHITRDVAEELLAGSRKEVAENLMIVDLIRHDLHSVVGENVDVKKFCGVEEYETVWQLVSVIEGQLPEGTSVEVDDSLGWEVLKRSLPPGSMTGAPKKRSVEILQSLETSERGPYSGVFGYWCAGGGGDWSVTIRSCFRHDSQRENEEEWVVGAGGAITALSDPDAEWDEMAVKLQSVLRSFGAST